MASNRQGKNLWPRDTTFLFFYMFEQSLYEQEPIQHPQADAIVEPVKKGDLFSTYEIKSWSPSPRLYKILGASAAVNLLALLVFAQTSVLTMKGCDSPLVGSVCQVLDTVYVGAMLFGTEREFADVAYEKTEIDNATLVFTELPPESEKLEYPSDYFQIANPVQYQAMPDQQNGVGLPPGYLAPGIPGNPAGFPPTTTPYKPGSSIFDTPANIPKRNNNVTDLSKLPKDLDDNDVAGTGPITKVKKPKTGSSDPEANKLNPDGTIKGFPGLKPTPETNAQAADPKEEATADQFGIFINKRPIKDKAKDTVAKVEANEVKLDTTFKVVISGTLGMAKDGKTMVLKNPQTVKPEPGIKNDPVMEKLVKEWIVAVGDAGWYGYLDKFDVDKKIKNKKVLIVVEQNDSEFFASIKAEQIDENMAKTLSSGLGGVLTMAKDRTNGDEQVFIQAATSTSEGKSLVLNIRMPKPQVQEMIQRKLAEQKAEPPQPNGNALVRSGNNTAAK